MNNATYKKVIIGSLSFLVVGVVSASQPKLSIVPLIPGSNAWQANQGDIFDISYTVTNNLKDTKTFTMKPITGVTQRTQGEAYCDASFTLAPCGSCTLRLRIDTSAMPLNTNLDNGPEICIGTSLLSCSRPSAANSLAIDVIAVPSAPLTISSTDVVTTTSTIAGSGALRTITIKNTGSSSATGMNYVRTNLPAETVVITPPACNPIVPGTPCVITVLPSTTPNTTGAVSPTPATLTISGTNTNKLVADITVLTYGNIYQGGYVYKIDATTPPNTNVSGSIAGLTDLLNGASIPWFPGNTTIQVPNVTSIIDGSSNTASIVATYKSGNYAAYNCTQIAVDNEGNSCQSGKPCFTNWYLPAICEISSTNTYSAACTSYPNSIMSNLYANGYGQFNSNTTYWASTSYTSGTSDAEGWQMTSQAAIPYVIPGWSFPVRCVRTMT